LLDKQLGNIHSPVKIPFWHIKERIWKYK